MFQALSEMEAHELIEWIDSEVRNGRLYRLTEKGEEIVGNLE